jgi:hypothetical protein
MVAELRALAAPNWGLFFGFDGKPNRVEIRAAAAVLRRQHSPADGRKGEAVRGSLMSAVVCDPSS